MEPVLDCCCWAGFTAANTEKKRARALGVELSIDAINQRAAQWAQTDYPNMMRHQQDDPRGKQLIVRRYNRTIPKRRAFDGDTDGKRLEPTFKLRNAERQRPRSPTISGERPANHAKRTASKLLTLRQWAGTVMTG